MLTPESGLVVVICTRDLGHAGEFGYAYSDRPLAATPLSGDWMYVDVPSHIDDTLPGWRIDAHWIEVADREG